MPDGQFDETHRSSSKDSARNFRRPSDPAIVVIHEPNCRQDEPCDVTCEMDHQEKVIDLSNPD
jgi:hypothetical protein